MAVFFSRQAFCLWSGLFAFALIVCARFSPRFLRKPISKLISFVLNIRMGTSVVMGDFFVFVYFMFWMVQAYYVYEEWTEGGAPVNEVPLMGFSPHKCKSWRNQRDCYIAAFAFMNWWFLKIMDENLKDKIRESDKKRQ